jgi:formylglycine-generating enzyme required for sulfatase activity
MRTWRIPGGTFRMGSDHHYPEEAPIHRVTVARFWMDRTPVTNRQFRKFVEDTGYVTFAASLGRRLSSGSTILKEVILESDAPAGAVRAKDELGSP